jgi:high-affinity nickel-transport protein
MEPSCDARSKVTHPALLTLAVALGLRHGVDPDHLAAIDALSRLRPSRWNGVLFALGHGALVTLLAIGVGRLLALSVGPYAPWLLILLGAVNLWRLRTPTAHHHRSFFRIAQTSPLLLGILFGAGFETASQLSALVLAADINPWVLGVAFSAGMMLVDGTDGYLASRTQNQAIAGGHRALRASRALGVFVVIFSFGLGGAELLKLNVDRIALPLGCTLFVYLVILRVWSSRDLRQVPHSLAIPQLKQGAVPKG